MNVTPTTTNRRIRSVPLVFGVLFVALGYIGIIAASDVDDAGVWMWPAALVAVGGAGLFATVRTALARRPAPATHETANDDDPRPAEEDPMPTDAPPDHTGPEE